MTTVTHTIKHYILRFTKDTLRYKSKESLQEKKLHKYVKCILQA